jgi:hypothetical protein
MPHDLTEAHRNAFVHGVVYSYSLIIKRAVARLIAL